MQITEQIIERIARRTFNSMFAPALRQSNVVTSGSGSSVSWADNAGHANNADTATTAGSADTAASANAAPWTGITDKPATATRWPAWSEVTNKPDVAIQAEHNNLLAAGNEFTFASSGFSGDIWLNYRTAGGLNGAITGYTLGDGAGHALGTIIHSGNISTQSVNYATSAGKATNDSDGNAINSTYLKLSGGTMTGALTLKASQYAGYMTGSSRTYAMNANNSDIVGINALIMADKSDGWTESIGFPRDGNDAGHYDTFRAANGTFYFGFNGYYDSSNVEHAAAEIVTITGGAIQLARQDANNAEFRVKNSGRDLSLFAGATNIGMYYNTGSKWIIGTDGSNTWLSTGNVGIGTTSPSYKLHVSGQIYCTGGFTFLSDERKKNIIDHDVQLSVDDIANAPLIHYTLKDDPEKRVRVGSIAQYWKRVLPESVNHAEDGTLSMNYDLQAHASVIVLARKVRELERIIYNLQSRIA